MAVTPESSYLLKVVLASGDSREALERLKEEKDDILLHAKQELTKVYKELYLNEKA